VIGMVNMNIITVDITGIPAAAVGNEIVIIGKQGRHHITVSSFSDLANYVNYLDGHHMPVERFSGDKIECA
jgi:alanine racemase